MWRGEQEKFTVPTPGYCALTLTRCWLRSAWNVPDFILLIVNGISWPNETAFVFSLENNITLNLLWTNFMIHSNYSAEQLNEPIIWKTSLVIQTWLTTLEQRRWVQCNINKISDYGTTTDKRSSAIKTLPEVSTGSLFRGDGENFCNFVCGISPGQCLSAGRP